MLAPVGVPRSAPTSLSVSVGALALVSLAACGGGTETSVDRCSNGRDDDGDGLVDCADPACRVYAFCGAADAGRRDAGPVDAAPWPDGALCARPIDAVLTLDVSSSMADELAVVRDWAPALVESLRALDPEAQVSLVVFVDDALAVSDCAPFDSGASLAAEIDAWRMRARENRSPVSGTFNQDCPENSLDALHLAATRCFERSDAVRLVVHLTDDTFAEHPAVLSGPYGGGVLVQTTYEQTAAALVGVGARVVAVTLSGPGEDCGAGRRSPDVGQGFHTPFGGQRALPEQTGGLALDLAALRAGTLALEAEVAALVESACR
jgi:hypothetical protein